MLVHVFAVLVLLWLLSARGWCHPFAYFFSFFYLYLAIERHILRLQKRIRHEEKLHANESKPFVDFESVRWLNHAIAKVWPIFIENIISQHILLPMIPWFLDRYKPWTAREASIHHLYLGKKAPEINKIRVTQSSNHDHLALDLGMYFVSGDDMSATFTVKLRKRLGLGIRARMHVTNMHIEGRVLVGINFLQEWPFIGSVRMSFVESPYFQINVKPIFHHGLDVTELPGIAGWLDRIFSLAFQQTLVQPNMLVLDVKKLIFHGGEKFFIVHEKTPVAFAEVEILEGADIKPLNLSDLYVKGCHGNYRFRTKVQRRTNSPKWFEEYLVPIHSWDEPNMLFLEVCNKDYISGDCIGSCTVDINKLRGGSKHTAWISLQNTEKGKLYLGIRVLEQENLKADNIYEDAALEKTETEMLPEAIVEDAVHAQTSRSLEMVTKLKDKLKLVNINEHETAAAQVHDPENDTPEILERRKAKNLGSGAHPFHLDYTPSPRWAMPTSQCSSPDSREKHGEHVSNTIARLKQGLKKAGDALHRSPRLHSSEKSVSSRGSSF